MAETPVVSFAQKPMQSFDMTEKQKAVPAYTIEAVKRKTVVNRTVKDEIGFRIVPTDVEVDGYMVRTLRGDSVFLLHDDVVRLRLNRNLVPLLMEGGDDTPVGMQQVSAALSDKQKQSLDVLTKLIESDPSLVERLLASKDASVDEEDK
jgi:hypothetical protein